jgi:hypothetical protein
VGGNVERNRVLLLVDTVYEARRRRTPVAGLAQWLETMVGRVRQVLKQTKIRIFAGDTKLPANPYWY